MEKAKALEEAQHRRSFLDYLLDLLLTDACCRPPAPVVDIDDDGESEVLVAYSYVFLYFFFCYLLYLLLANFGCSLRATAVNVKDDDSDFPSISSYVFLSLFISLFPVMSSSLHCSILAGTSSKKQVPSRKTDVLTEKIKDDRPVGGPPPFAS